MNTLPDIRWLLGLAGLYVAWLAILYVAQRSMVYPGTRIGERPPLAADRADREILWLDTGSAASRRGFCRRGVGTWRTRLQPSSSATGMRS